MIDQKRWLGTALLCLTSFIWGTSFVASVKGLRILSPYTFNTYRFLLAFLFIFAASLLWDAVRARGAGGFGGRASEWKAALLPGSACGMFLFVASAFQQVGLQHTQAGKAAFITTLYIVIVPVFCLFAGRKIARTLWVGIAMGVAGLYLLSMTESMTMALPDLLVLIGSFFWAGHILCCDHFALKCDALKMSTVQFGFTCAAFALFAVLFETPPAPGLWRAAFPAAFFAGLVATGIGFTLQIVAQQYTPPTVTSLILSMESVFAAWAGYVFLAEVLTRREFAGCVLIFAAILLAQLPSAAAPAENRARGAC